MNNVFNFFLEKMKNEINEEEAQLSNDKILSEKNISKKVGNYIIEEQLGVGTFSKVTKGIHTLTGEKVAIKILDKSKIKDEIDIERINREIEILKSISHVNISFLYESKSTIHNFYLIMEYIEGGDLSDYISKNVSLPENIACRFFRQLISVIEYLNEMGIVHRDIKPENILLDSSKKNIKVIDFGLSNYCTNSEMLQSACGSPCFASPEMISGHSYKGVTTDLWSAGIVLYSMLVGTLPFDDQELNILYEQIKIGTFYIPSNLSLESIDFLKRILQVDPQKRINIKEIKEHPWFNIEKNPMYKGIDLTVETFPYDEKLIDYVMKKYLSKDKDISKNNFILMIQYHACNEYTTTYYLVEKYFKKHKKYKSEKNNDFIQNLNAPEILEQNNNDRIAYTDTDIEINMKNKINIEKLKANEYSNINNKEDNLNNKKFKKMLFFNNKIMKPDTSKETSPSQNKKKEYEKIIKKDIKKENNNRKNKNKINSTLLTLKDNKISENNYKNKKIKSWSKGKKKYILKTKQKNNNLLFNKLKINRNKLKLDNFQTEINSQNSTENNIRANSLLEDQKNIKINSFKIETQKNKKKYISPRNKEIILINDNKTNYLNTSKYKDLMNDKNEKNKTLRDKFYKISFNNFNKKIFINPNFNTIQNKLNISHKNNALNEKYNKNKIKSPNSNLSLLFLKKKYFESKNMNKSLNKYKELIDEFNSGYLTDKKENLKTELINDYFTENNKYIKNNKFSSLTNNNSQNKSILPISKKLNKNINKNAIYLTNKKNQEINNEKLNYYKKNKQKKIININSINNKSSVNNNLSKLFFDKLKKISIKEQDNKTYSSYIKTEINDRNQKYKNISPNKILSLSPLHNNNNKTIAAKKIINININNILKIDKKYSISRNQNNPTKNNLYNNNNSELFSKNSIYKINNYYSCYPLSSEKFPNNKSDFKHKKNNNETNIKYALNHQKINQDLQSFKNYSSMLKKQLLNSQLHKKNY